jgi:hypothetical protein
MRYDELKVKLWESRLEPKQREWFLELCQEVEKLKDKEYQDGFADGQMNPYWRKDEE